MFDWKVAYAPNKKCKDKKINSIKELNDAGFDSIPATIPGNFELDLINAGKLEDLYFSTNVLKAQELENLHCWYYTKFQLTDVNQYLYFEGIDTIADIYVNGQLVKTVENMFLPYEVDENLRVGENELIVHIKPICIEMRKNTVPVSCISNKYNYSSLYARKAAHMFGWDIFPRIVSNGIWKPVLIKQKKNDKINEVFFETKSIDLDKKSAQMRFYINADISEDFITDYRVKVSGRCENSSFEIEETMWNNSYAFNFDISNAKFWWPRNAGDPNLYDVEIILSYKGEIKDSYSLRIGVRKIELERSDTTDSEGNGEFCFKVNGRKIFILGTNWVALDSLHSNDINRVDDAIRLAEDVGCNMIRCWGGNVYESDRFFELCDEKGIMVWQDFVFACSVYPQEKEFFEKIEEELVFQIKRLRNHASLALWSGDNETDMCMVDWDWHKNRRNPNDIILSRKFIRDILNNHDYSRPYLPSSPYLSRAAFDEKTLLPEMHMWGPRDYFKGDFYKNHFCHFSSEQGYHGFPSFQSLQKFLKEPEKIFKEEDIPTDEYLAHASCMEISMDSPYAYRINLACEQVKTLFGEMPEDIHRFILESQISQAEADKFFIEKARINKWKSTGIIWWNLIDGWPQVSDSVVDYYFEKKLAYYYIKRSQESVCFMFDEPENGQITLCGVNDLPYAVEAEYCVYDIEQECEIIRNHTILEADSVLRLDGISVSDDEQKCYLVEWKIGEVTYKNHYYTNLIDICFDSYIDAVEKCGMEEYQNINMIRKIQKCVG